MRLVFVMDPVSSVIVDEDTSFALMHAAQERGHRVDHCLVRDVWLDGARCVARVRRASMDPNAPAPVVLGEPEELDLADVDVVMVRKDPPFDVRYLWLTLILEHVRGRTLVVNDPRGLRECNEHLHILHFPEVSPQTLVTSDRKRIRRFIDEVGGRAIVKPVDGHGGDKIFVLDAGDLNLNSILETITHNETVVVMCQRYLPEVRTGDKRILLLDGEPLGAILRVPAADDARSNIHVGGKVVSAELDERDREIAERVGPRLQREGLWFAGLDVIGGCLTEINVTSPTGIQQMSRLMGEDLPARVLAWVEKQT